MDKMCNGSSMIYDKKTFDFVSCVMCYLVILYYDLDLILIEVASNGLEVAPFRKNFSFSM